MGLLAKISETSSKSQGVLFWLAMGVPVIMIFGIIFFDSDSELQDLFVAFLISSLFVGLICAPFHFFRRDFKFGTAISNYFLMLVESTTMVLGFSFSPDILSSFKEDSLVAESFFYAFVVTLFFFFLIHTISYSISTAQSLLDLSIIVAYIGFSTLFTPDIQGDWSSALVMSLAVAGYLFVWSLVLGGIWTFVRFWYVAKKHNPDKKAPKDVKIALLVVGGMFAITFFIPCLWLLVLGFSSFFGSHTTVFSYLVSAAFFFCVLVRGSKNFGNKLTDFMGGRTKLQ